jgi:MFS family permease
MTSEARPHRRSLWALDWLNVFVADGKTGVGPYLAIYLQASRHWNPAHIGLAMAAMGLASVAAQTPAGALTDRLRQKRWMLVAASVVVAIGCLWIVMRPTLSGVLVAQAVIGSTATIFPASIAAITLGLVGPSKLASRMGRNEACNHAGNVGAALLAGFIGYYIAREGIFYLVVALSGATILMVLMIREDDIDHLQARGALGGSDRRLRYRPGSSSRSGQAAVRTVLHDPR